MSSRTPSALGRRERERLQRRQAMLRAARAVFAERGYVHATLEEVAERAEFGKGTLYNYFPGGKEELLRAVLDGLFRDLMGLMRPFTEPELPDEALAAPGAFRAALHGYFERLARYFYAHPDLFHLLMREARRLRYDAEEESRAYLHGQLRRSGSTLSAFLKRAAAAGAIKPLPRRPVAHALLVCATNHLAVQEMTGWPRDARRGARKTADFLTELLVDGLGA